MRKLLTTLLFICVALALYAQNADSTRYQAFPVVDSLSLGNDIFKALSGNVRISQSPAVETALRNQLEQNRSKLFFGFRIKIYFENSSVARTRSEEAERKCKELFPEYECYRSFANPYFKVVLGEFRTRIEAEKALREVKTVFPDAAIIKDKFRWPSLNEGRAYEPAGQTGDYGLFEF